MKGTSSSANWVDFVGDRFVEIDHSGDVGIEALGEDLSELIVNLTYGLFSLLYRGEVKPVVERTLRVESQSIEDLLVDWLNEVIVIASTRGEAFGLVLVDTDGLVAHGVLRGELINPERHEPRFDVKAATYHGLLVDRDKNGMRARVIFDL